MDQVAKTEPGVQAKSYDPFTTFTTDESEKSFLRNYDKNYGDYMKAGEIRIAYQLALRYFQDANPPLGKLLTGLQGHEIVLLDREPDNPLHYLFAGNCVAHQNVTDLSSVDLQTNQTLILSTEALLDPNDLHKISNFVSNGGLLISFNKAISIVASAFPGLVKYKRGETTQDKKIDVVVPETDDKNLFLGLDNATQRGKAARFTGVRRFDSISDQVQILAQETSPSTCPLAAKISVGQGLIFHLLHVGTNEVLELRSKEKAQFYCKQVEEVANISEATKGAWKTAFSCSQWGSFYLAISLLPFFDILFGIINKYKRH